MTAFLTQVVNEEHRPSLKSDCPQPYFQLVSSCLQSDPHSRPSFGQIASAVYGVNEGGKNGKGGGEREMEEE